MNSINGWIAPIIHDHFFERPEKVREAGLSSVFNDLPNPIRPSVLLHKTDHLNKVDPPLHQLIISTLCNKVLKIPEGGMYLAHSLTMSWQYCTKADLLGTKHRDNAYGFTHVFLIYMAPDAPACGGTTIYRDGQEYPLENKYNRCVVYDPRELHDSTSYFGSTLEDGRLFIVGSLNVMIP